MTKESETQDQAPARKAKLSKVILIGPANIGKTKLMVRWVDNKYEENYRATIGADFRTRAVVNGDSIQIWDTAGQELFQASVTGFYEGADALLLCYDASEPDGCEKARKVWEGTIGGHYPDRENRPSIVIVGLKADEEISSNGIHFQQASAYAKQREYAHILISAKDDNRNSWVNDLDTFCLYAVKDEVDVLEYQQGGKKGGFILLDEEPEAPEIPETLQALADKNIEWWFKTNITRSNQATDNDIEKLIALRREMANALCAETENVAIQPREGIDKDQMSSAFFIIYHFAYQMQPPAIGEQGLISSKNTAKRYEAECRGLAALIGLAKIYQSEVAKVAETYNHNSNEQNLWNALRYQTSEGSVSQEGQYVKSLLRDLTGELPGHASLLKKVLGVLGIIVGIAGLAVSGTVIGLSMGAGTVPVAPIVTGSASLIASGVGIWSAKSSGAKGHALNLKKAFDATTRALPEGKIV